MQLDRNAINRLLAMNDDQLKTMIRVLAENSGLDLSSFQIHPSDVDSIRRALAGATDADLARAAEQLRSAKKHP